MGGLKPTDPTALARLRILDLVGDEITRAVRALYARVATAPDHGFHFPTGREAARLVGYAEEDLARAPPDAVARFAGVGCPLPRAHLRAGERVLDLGCGGGLDLFLAAERVGPKGHVTGVDVTPEMVARTAALAERLGVRHVSVTEARAPHVPALAEPVDVVLSNGAINLVPGKDATLRALHALLRPGGRLAVADVVLSRPPSAACVRDASLWAECLVGAFTEDAYSTALEDAGFVDVRVHERRDYFAASPSESTRATARDLGAFAWVVTARRA